MPNGGRALPDALRRTPKARVPSATAERPVRERMSLEFEVVSIEAADPCQRATQLYLRGITLITFD